VTKHPSSKPRRESNPSWCCHSHHTPFSHPPRALVKRHLPAPRARVAARARLPPRRSTAFYERAVPRRAAHAPPVRRPARRRGHSARGGKQRHAAPPRASASPCPVARPAGHRSPASRRARRRRGYAATTRRRPALAAARTNPATRATRARRARHAQPLDRRRWLRGGDSRRAPGRASRHPGAWHAVPHRCAALPASPAPTSGRGSVCRLPAVRRDVTPRGVQPTVRRGVGSACRRPDDAGGGWLAESMMRLGSAADAILRRGEAAAAGGASTQGRPGATPLFGVLG
jgi:hypothetical protein